MTARRLSPQEKLYLYRTINEIANAVAREMIVIRPDNPMVKFDTGGTGTQPLNDFLRKRRERR